MGFENERAAVLLADEIHAELRKARAEVEALKVERDEARALMRVNMNAHSEAMADNEVLRAAQAGVMEATIAQCAEWMRLHLTGIGSPNESDLTEDFPEWVRAAMPEAPVVPLLPEVRRALEACATRLYVCEVERGDQFIETRQAREVLAKLPKVECGSCGGTGNGRDPSEPCVGCHGFGTR